MSNEHEEQVPGITFWFKQSSVSGGPSTDVKFVVDLTLTCGVADEELWEDILKRFKDSGGFRVFTSNDFHIEVMDVMRGKIHDLETAKLRLEAELRQKTDELESMRAPLSAFGQALRSAR